MHRWLRPGGAMSHQIDLASAYGPEWNRHWAMGDVAWRVLGMRYRVNRAPLSAYLALCEECGFEVLGVTHVPGEGVRRDRLAPRFRSLPDDDHAVRSAHLAARRR